MAATQTAPAAGRLFFIDNLRWICIALVVAMHAAVTYSNFGRWYFMEPAPRDTPTLLFFGLFQSSLQAWFMGFLFFVAEYFVPPALDRKGPGRFLADRAIRLGIPSLFYMLVIHPFVVWVMLPLYRTGHVTGFATRWYRYAFQFRIGHFGFVEGSGPMWFAVALLVFCVAYAAIRRRPAAATPKPGSLPGSGAVAGLILLIAACTFLMRVLQPIGTAILNMQLCFFSQYVILFVLGTLARRNDWLLRLPYRFGMRWFIAALVLGPLMWIGVVVGGGALRGVPMEFFNGGWHWQSAANAIWESFFCVGVCLGLTVLFREKLDRQGRLASFLSANAFSVYVFHTPMLIAVTMALHPLAAPALVKFLLATALAFALTVLASEYVLRRIPLLRRVL